MPSFDCDVLKISSFIWVDRKSAVYENLEFCFGLLENFDIFFTINRIRTRNGCLIKDNTFTMNQNKKIKK